MSKSHRRQLKRMRQRLNSRLMDDAGVPTHDANGNRLGLRRRLAAAGYTDLKAFNKAVTDKLELLAGAPFARAEKG